jgi:hypothetical protein
LAREQGIRFVLIEFIFAMANYLINHQSSGIGSMNSCALPGLALRLSAALPSGRFDRKPRKLARQL